MAKPNDDQFTEAETVRRRDAALKRMLATPPTPHKPASTTGKKPTAVKAKRARTK